MDKLLTPDAGLMFWTVVTFLLLAALLRRYAWGPLLAVIAEREERLKAEAAAARLAREEAQRIQAELAAQLAQAAARREEVLARAAQDGEAVLTRFKSEAERQARELRDKTAAELAREKERLVRELRLEVAGLSVQAAEKLLRRSVDPAVEKQVLDDFLGDLERKASS
ncbi:MAG: F0F1 ATP synthase subunit B [Elusimicrobia bacterium]|nr:F0F1 ATP synthase subunit B [Elusimicrobiota bacterium]